MSIKRCFIIFVCIFFACCKGRDSKEPVSVLTDISYSLPNESGKNDITPTFSLSDSVYLTLRFKTNTNISFENSGRKIGSFFSKKADKRNVITEIIIPSKLGHSISRCIDTKFFEKFTFTDENDYIHAFFTLPINSRDKIVEFFISPTMTGRFHVYLKNYLVKDEISEELKLEEYINKGYFTNLSESVSDFTINFK